MTLNRFAKYAEPEQQPNRFAKYAAEPRTLTERFADNVSDSWHRTLLAQRLREHWDPNRSGGFDLGDLADWSKAGFTVGKGGDIDIVLRAFGHDIPQDWKNEKSLAAERARREDYEARSKADPFYRAPGGMSAKTYAAVATLSGQLFGSLGSPENLVAPGRTVIGRMVGGAAVSASADAVLQVGDVADDVQDEYSPLQTAFAAGVGGGISLINDGVIRPLAAFVDRAFTTPKARRVAPEPPKGVVARVAQALGAKPAPPAPKVPPLAFVQPVEPHGAWSDAHKAVDEKGLLPAIGEWADKLYTAGVSEQHPLVMAVEDLRSGIEAETGKPLDLAPGSDPRKLARGAYDVQSIGHADVMHGVHPYRGLSPDSPALADVVAAVTARDVIGEAGTPETALKAFNDYLVARRGVEEWGRFERGELAAEPLPAAKGGDRASLENHIAAAETENPHYVEMADAVNQYGRALWKKHLDSGLIDQATYDAANAARDFYVPFKRAMEETATKPGSGASNKGDAAKRFKGSERDVLGPIEMLVKATYDLNTRIRQNDLNVSLVNLAERLDKLVQHADPEAGNGVLRPVQRPSEPIHVSADEAGKASNASDAAGLADRLFGEDGATFFRPGEINEAGRPVFYAWRGGERTAHELIDPVFGREVYQALTGMSAPMADLFGDMLKIPAMVLRAGITTNPEFALVNLVRDQLSAWVLTDVGFKPGEGLVGVAQELTGSDASRLYTLGGGLAGGQSVAALRETATRGNVMALRARGVRAKYFSDLQGFMSLTEVSETGTRLRLFQRSFERAKAEGMNEYDALIEAAFSARDLLDFGRNGSRMAFSRKVITFLNASLQGLDKTLRVVGADGALTRVPLKDALRPLFGADPKAAMRREDAAALRLAGKAWAKVSAMAVFGMALTAAQSDNAEYQQVPEYQRASNWVFVYGDRLVMIPKPFDLGVPSTILERAWEAAHFQDPAALEKMVAGVWQTLAPPLSNPMISEPLQLATNTNLRTGGKIVSESKLDALPQDQFNAWTSELSRKLGAAVGVSPAKIDHAILGFGGTWGRWLLSASNLTDPDRPSMELADAPMSRRFIGDWTHGAQDQTAFYERVGARTSDLARRLTSIRERMESGRQTDAAALLGEADEPGRAYLLTQLAAEPMVRRLHPIERARVVALEAGRMVDELHGGRPKDAGERGQFASAIPHLSASDKAVTQDALERLVVAEMRNAMIVSGQPGYEHRAPMDRAKYLAELDAIDPALAVELEHRVRTGRDKAFSYEAVTTLWPKVEGRLRQGGERADLVDLAGEAVGRSAQ